MRGQVGQVGEIEGGERYRPVWIGGMRGVVEVGQGLAEEGIAATGQGDGDRVVGVESGG